MTAPVAKPLRAVVYVRLSVFRGERDPSVSADEQERKCRAYCEAKGWDVVEVVRDLDVSGSEKGLRLDRPGLQEVRGLLPSIDVVVFAKLDRLARNVMDFRAFDEECTSHGTVLVSVNESLDMTTPAGRFFGTILAAFAEMEAAQVAERVATARGALAGLRRFGGGTPPYGYRSAPAHEGPGRVLVVDEHEAASMTEAAERLLQGETPYSIALDFTARGVPMRRGKTWRMGTLTAALQSDAIVGRMTHRGELVRDETGLPVQAWPPALDPALWHAVRATLGRTSRMSSPRRRAALLLSGLAHCGSCGGLLYVRRGRGVASYACIARNNGAVCPRIVSIRSDALEAHVTREFLSRAGSLPVFRVEQAADEDALARLAEAETALDRIMAGLRDVDDERRESALLVERRLLRASIADLRQAAERTSARTVDTGQTFADAWKATESPAALRSLLTLAQLEGVVVHPVASKRPDDVANRKVELLWAPEERAGTIDGS